MRYALSSLLKIYIIMGRHATINSKDGKSVSYKYYVDEGNTIQYSIKVVNGTNFSVSSFLLTPSGVKSNSINFTGSSASSSIIATTSGNWTLTVTSNNNSNLTLDIYFGNLPSYEGDAVIYGFTLLVVGIGLIGIYYMIKRRENERISRRYGS